MSTVTTAPTRARTEAGKRLRRDLPRTAHGFWVATPARPDPVAVLRASNAHRLAHLVPIRHARMAESPLAYYRGSAAMMAHDLATTPVTGLTVQAGGDAHLLNFGGFATPERNHIFDLTDFDETLPGPWEWDLKRLATSIVLAARLAGGAETGAGALAAANAYRLRMQELAAASALEVWYARLEAVDILAEARSVDDSQRVHAVAKFSQTVEGVLRLRDDPPLLYHAAAGDGLDVARILAGYAYNLAPDVRVLFERYRLVDAAVKVVGVGSVGTRCALALLRADDDDLQLLQIKEALPSVLAAHLPKSVYRNEGERVVRGQRLMQAASDVFLGWAAAGGRDFYVRQFKDKKATADLTAMNGEQLSEYAAACARALAGAHARSGDPAAIAGYLGKSDVFDRALLAFAQAYADQTEADYAAFIAAIERGAIEAA